MPLISLNHTSISVAHESNFPLSKIVYLIQKATVWAISWIWQCKVFHNRVLLILFQDPARWLALNAMELVTSRLSAEEVNRELSLRRARWVWWHIWRWGWGTCELRYCCTILGVSQSVPWGSPSKHEDFEIQGPIQKNCREDLTATKQELWETWARCRAAHADMHSRKKCTGWGEGCAEAGIRPDIAPFKKHHSTRLCSALVALVTVV